MRIYKLFSKYIANTFLTDDKKGEYVALIIDKQFMECAANELNLTLDKLILGLRNELYCEYCNKNLDINFVLVIVSLQLYAASKRERFEKISEHAYNTRLCEIMNYNSNSLWKWYKKNQILIWKTFYKWCRDNNFQIQECLLRDGKYKYAQYPLELAKHTFNREDLKYISFVFHKNKISVSEDIRYADFWRLFDVKWAFASLSNHCTGVLESIYADTHSYDIAKSQIYNHFLSWNGEYKDPLSFQSRITSTPNDKQISISNKSGVYEVYVRNRETEELINKITVDRNILTSLNAHYKLKRDGVIIFQQNNDYSNVWDETRYIESRDTMGLAIVMNKPYLLGHATQIYCCDNVCLYEFDYNEQTHKYYSDESQTYELIGGLRIARQTYLSNGAPILRLHQDGYYLLNGKTVNQAKGDHLLDLDEGEYTLKFQRRREFRIIIVSPSPITKEWSDKFCKWELSRKEYVWASHRDIEGIVGLDYRIYSATSNLPSILQRWVKAHQGEIVNDNKNITLKSLNSQNRYE